MRDYLEKLLKGISLSQQESVEAGRALFSDADPHQAAAFLALLRAKKETPDEIVGLVSAIRERSTQLKLNRRVLDIVGTGGDGAGSVNISTASALLAAACGVPVVKHGNRAISSMCGSADVLEALGYDIRLDPKRLSEDVERSNFGFCLAPLYHPALAFIRPIRKGLGIPTVFHLLGPLLNPAGTDHLLLGVYDQAYVELLAEALFRLGTKRSLVFHGNGLDELSCLGPIQGILVTEQGKEMITLDPFELGLQPCTMEALKGRDADFNAQAIREAFSGRNTILAETLALNAAAALFIYGAVDTLEEGIKRVQSRLQQGPILKKNHLQEIVARKKGLGHSRKSLKEAICHKAIIGEIKRASPSVGSIAKIEDPAQKAIDYMQSPVKAISVLTDEAFSGSLEDLKAVSAISTVPILCKDFFVRPEQIAEAAKAGADAILLIVAALKQETKTMIQAARLFGLEALVEVHNEHELTIALEAGAEIIGVNQRDLSDFTMHPSRFQELVDKIPQDKIKVAESGIRSFKQACDLFEMGYDAVLIGEALSRLEDPKLFFEGCHVD